mgnify:CR=1 FL=1
MIRLPTLLLPVLLLAGCATTSMTPVVKDKPASAYRNVLTLILEDSETEFRNFDAATYNRFVKDHFNRLANIEYRRQLERALQRNLSVKNTRVLTSSELFEVNEEVSYKAFSAVMEEQGVEAILLIDLHDYWHSESNYYDADSGIVWEDVEPNAAYLCYLIDLASGRPQWLAKSTVRGIWAGYDTLNNHLARRLTRELREKGYVYQPVVERR